MNFETTLPRTDRTATRNWAPLQLALGVVGICASLCYPECSIGKDPSDKAALVHDSVQAPYDAFVCFSTSFNVCLDTIQSGRIKSYSMDAYKDVYAGGIIAKDDAEGTKISTKDNKYACDFGHVGYKQSLDPEKTRAAVFVSPVLLQQIGELRFRVSRARRSCERLVAAYEFQSSILKQQDALSRSQKASTLILAEITNERVTKEGFGTRTASADEAKNWNVKPGSTYRDALKEAQEKAVTTGETLREAYKNQVLKIDYQKQFDDANQNIYFVLRELSRMLMTLDRSSPEIKPVRGLRSEYPDHSWVKQGTVVLYSTE